MTSLAVSSMFSEGSTHARGESGRPTSRTRTRLGRSRAFPRSGGRVGVGPCMSCCTAATGQPSGSCGEEKLSLSRARPGLRAPAVARRGRTSRVRRRSGTPRRLHRAEGSSRSTGRTRVSAQRVNSPRVSRPPYFGNPRRVRPPGVPQTRPRRLRLTAPIPRVSRPIHRVLARSSRNNPVSRAVSSVASPPSQDASVSDAEAKASGAEISRGGDGPVRPEFCDISEEDVQKRRIVVMEPGATVVCTAEEKIFGTLLDVVKGTSCR